MNQLGAVRRLKGREIERALAAGLIFSVAGMIAPILMFSGTSTRAPRARRESRAAGGPIMKNGSAARFPSRTATPSPMRDAEGPKACAG